MARTILDEFPNAFIGVTGVVTNCNNQTLRGLVRDVIPLDRLLIETDGPYMVPQGIRSSVCAFITCGIESQLDPNPKPQPLCVPTRCATQECAF
jgi:Tat protein secretion system quality control protein TatD with DNase activity